MQNHNCRDFEFDVALSFAGEDRKYVEAVASFLLKSGLKVFYDKYEKANLWGKDLYQHLDNVYQNTSKYVVIFISQNYAKKLWTSHELKSAQARAFTESKEYILPARFDSTEIPGVRKTLGYIDLNEHTPSELAKLIIQKLEKHKLENVLPRDAKRLKQLLALQEWDFDDEEIDFICHNIFTKLKLLSQDEKFVIGKILIEGCEHDLPNDIHIEMKVLERHTQMSREDILATLNNITGLGFEYKIKKVTHGTKRQGNQHKEELLSLTFTPLTEAVKYDNITLFLVKMFAAAYGGYCLNCAFNGFLRLDFSNLKKSFTKKELAEFAEDEED
ncbi:TIR domain-containing protein [Pseudoflavitalea sp. X16]|uniref:toll/interleukin-1 receptor domain-containing protein n=1 Tax=Paraflavitalea devenefica TaxID=2716334 RepID=UPI001420A732|nr:TIR domain-containing protein [Paraflavitalea devenefica]NII28114.1 TIR domain-containing protein [Paraflavitalea devenefica]